MRILLYTGKGGVGKTTVAAATGLVLASRGLKTLVMSVDAAHSLADSFEVEIGSEPVEVAPNLWAQQIDAQERLESNWREIQEYVIQLMNWAGTETIQAEDGSLPLLRPMSEVAGRMSVQVGASCLEKERGGKGVLLGGVPGTRRGRVVILGGGVVGRNAATIAIGCPVISPTTRCAARSRRWTR